MRQRSGEGKDSRGEGEGNTKAGSKKNWKSFVKGEVARRVKRARDKRTRIGK